MSDFLLRQQSKPVIFSRRDAVHEISRDCDCACSETFSLQYEVEQPALHLLSDDAAFQVSPLLQTVQLAHEHHAVYVPSGHGVGDGIAVLNTPAMDLLRLFPKKTGDGIIQEQWGKEVIDAAIVDFVRLGFLSSVGSDSAFKLSDRSLPTNAVLSAWLHLTDRCNLHCAYCYVPQRQQDMALETGRAAIDAIFRSARKHGYQQVKVKYAGGEPLLRFPLLLQLQHYAQKIAAQHNIRLDGIILSNGALLTASMAQQMRAAGLRLMISLDELEHAGSQRCYPDGRGAAADAQRGIELALEAGIIPEISITISGQNIKHLPQLLQWVLGRNLPFGLNFYREHDRCNRQHDLALDTPAFIEGMLAAYKVIEANLPQRSLLASLLDRANLSAPHERPCNAGQHYLVIDTQGRIAACQMQMDQPVTSIYAEDPLEQIHHSCTGLQNPAVDQKSECAACAWKYWCAGGCPLLAVRATGRSDAPSPYCEIYKTLFPEVIRLEGLRLLAYSAGVQE